MCFTVGNCFVLIEQSLLLFFFYSEHAAELGNAVPSTPILFLKPPSAYITQGQAIKVSFSEPTAIFIS